MPKKWFLSLLSAPVAGLILLGACTTAGPSPTAAPAKPTEAPKPAVPAVPAANPAAAPAAAPAASPAAAPAAKPAASPAAAPAAPAAKPAASPAAAKPTFNEQAVADFYRGKTIRIVVGFAAGGGFDTFARLIGRHMSKHIPGNPTIVVDNMPGAGSLVAANHVYNNGPKDGTMIGSSSGALYLQALFGNAAVEFDATKQHFLGVPTSASYYMLVLHKRAGFTNISEALGPNGKQLVLGGESAGIGTHDGAVLMKEVLGFNIKLVGGYQGTAPLRKALEGGEIDGFLNGLDSAKLTQWDQIKSGELQVPTTWTYERSQEFPDAPTIMSFAKDEEQRRLLDYGLILPNQISRPYVLAPEVPAERVQALTYAFDQTVADKDFAADAANANIELSPLTGEDTRKRVQELFSMPESTKNRLKQLIGG
jgi:tripartite-type tricarboxylate transporter receptor subunit TctC